MQEVGLGIGDIGLVLKSQNMEVGRSKKQWPNNDDKGVEPYLEVEQTGQPRACSNTRREEEVTTTSEEAPTPAHAADCFTGINRWIHVACEGCAAVVLRFTGGDIASI